MPMSRMTLLSVSVTGSRCDTSALRPMAVATADRASSSGTPAANSAPKVSSRIPSVIGRLSFSAREKSSTRPGRRWRGRATRRRPRRSAGRAARGRPQRWRQGPPGPCRRHGRTRRRRWRRRRRGRRAGSLTGRPAAKVSSPTVATCGRAGQPGAQLVGSTAGRGRVESAVARGPGSGPARSASAGKPACSTTRSARPDSPVPCSAEVRSRVPAAPPATNTTATKTNQPISAFSRCRVLQRASRQHEPAGRDGLGRR